MSIIVRTRYRDGASYMQVYVDFVFNCNINQYRILRPDIREWAEGNANGIDFDRGTLILKDEDAIAFKLRFGNEILYYED